MAFQLKSNFITIIFALLFVVLVSIFITTHSYIPYDGKPAYTAYEAFQEGATSESTPVTDVADASESTVGLPATGGAKVVSGGADASGSIVGTGGAGAGTKKKEEGFDTLSPSYTSGFGGVYSNSVDSILSNRLVHTSLFASPVNSDEHLDKFLDVKTVGVDGLGGCQSSGLSNSRGALCLSPDLIQSLKTRGGNAGGI